MRIMLTGDSHGNTRQMEYWIARAAERKISHMIVLGDFGLWPGYEGVRYLDNINRAATEAEIKVMAVLGNHDAYNIFEAYKQFAPTHHGFFYLRDNLMATKVANFRLGGKTFRVAGGAVSVDRDWRIAHEKGLPYTDGFGQKIQTRAMGEQTLWWPQEQLTDSEIEYVKSFGEADILLTHDASDYTPWKNRLKPDDESTRHRHKIDDLIRAVKPKMHFHGHFHTKYDWTNTLGTDAFGAEPEVNVQTYGLEADYEAMNDISRFMNRLDNWGILDTTTLEFAFKGEGMHFRSME